MVRYKIVKKKGIRFPDNKKITYYELKKFIPKEKIWFCFGYAKTLKDANKQMQNLNDLQGSATWLIQLAREEKL